MSTHDPTLDAAPAGVALVAPAWVDDGGACYRRMHRNVLLLSAAILLAAALLHVTNGGGVALGSRSARALPSVCLTRSLLGIDCPGCGMTRSFVSMAHGDLVGAYRCHRVGPLLFLFLALQIPLRAYALLRRIDRPLWFDKLLGGRTVSLVIVLALFANWGYNLATGVAFH